MRFINSKTHGILDYLTGALLILAPWIFGFANGGPEQIIPILIGSAIILMSLFTDYEMSAVKLIPLSFHLGTDILAGLFLALSPWMFGFADVIFWPHLIVGILEMGAGLFTHRVPDYKFAQ